MKAAPTPRGFMHPTLVSASQEPFGVHILFEDLSHDTFGEFASRAVVDTFAIGSGEHICLVRGNLLEGAIVGLQFQTNYGRRSGWFGQTGAGTRFERTCAAAAADAQPQQIVGVTLDGIKSSRLPPQAKATTLRSLVMSPNVRALVLQRGSGNKSLALQSMAGGSRSIVAQGLRSGLASRLLRKDSEGHSLLRIVLEGEKDAEKVDVPQSLLRALAECPSNFEHSLMDLLFAGKEPARPPITRLFFVGGKSSLASQVFAHQTQAGRPSLAQLLFSQDRVKGLRSVLQLVTDDEALDDPSAPSILRMMAQHEQDDRRLSLVRLLVTRFNGASSLMDELVRGDDASEEGSVTRRLLTESDSRRSLVRDFLTDTPGGKVGCLRAHSLAAS
jgi:hypothetical protein